MACCLLLVMSAVPGYATTVYVGGINQGSNWWDGTWANLQVAVNAAGSGDVVKVCGNLTRSAGDTAGGITLANPGVTLSGGWNSGFTAQLWSPGGKLAKEIQGYSVLNVNGSDSANNRFRVLTITNTAANVKIEGFTITKGYVGYWMNDGQAGGILIGARGVRLSHLSVTGNTTKRQYSNCGNILVDATDVIVEYLTLTNNASVSSYLDPPYGAGISVSGNAGNGKVLIANSWIGDNTISTQSGYGWQGTAISFDSASVASTVWAVFGTVVRGHQGALSIGMDGSNDSGSRYDYLVNCTVVDNTGRVGVFDDWRYRNYIINTILADTAGTYSQGSGASWRTLRFQNTLIDPETPASGVGGASYFDGVGNVNLGGNITNSQPLFMDQALRDYHLLDSSPAKGGAAALYASNGLGFAYIDLDRNSSYTPTVDIIIDIVPGTCKYTPGAGEFYYPNDMNGERWLTTSRYSSNSNLVGKFSMGAIAPKSRYGTVITLK